MTVVRRSLGDNPRVMSEDFLPIFKERAAVLEGHFLLSSGLHSPRYVQCARVLMDPAARDPARRGARGVPP